MLLRWPHGPSISAAYAAFLDEFSKRWGAFAERDGSAKTQRRLATDRAADTDAVERADSALDFADQKASELRDDLFEAYTRIQILSPQDVVEAPLKLVCLSDERNRAFRKPREIPNPRP